MGNTRITRPADAEGVLLIAPTGLDRSWSVRAPSEGRRDEVAAYRALDQGRGEALAIDRDRIFLSGFSSAPRWHGISRVSLPGGGGGIPGCGRFLAAPPHRVRGRPRPSVPRPRKVGYGDAPTPVIRGSYRSGGQCETGIDIWRRENGCGAEPPKSRVNSR